MLVISGEQWIEMFMITIDHVINVKEQVINLLTQNLAKLVTTLLEKPFQKWRLDFIGHVKLVSKL
jgi:hypothetical protein